MPAKNRAEKLAEEWDEHKSRLKQQTLGKEHDMVMHALIPYFVGGALDLYYYPNGRPGVAIATKELSPNPNEGSSNKVYRSYELVMFTKLKLEMDAAQNPKKPFGKMHARMNAILNMIARYSADASLNRSRAAHRQTRRPLRIAADHGGVSIRDGVCT